MPPSRPTVSVILPCFDCAPTIEATVASALAQTLPPTEILAVDDGSTDGTGRILERLARDHPDRVRALRQEHSGPYVARNLAARQARGDYLAFLDSDDEWCPDKLERQAALMAAHEDVVLCHTGILVVSAQGAPARVKAPDPAYRGDCFRRLLISNGINTSSVMVRRRAFDAVGGFDEAFPARGDWELWTRLARRGRIEFIPEPLMRLLDHPGRMSFQTERMRRYHLAVIGKNAIRYRGLVPDLSRLIREARHGAHLQYASDFLEARRGARAFGEGGRAIRRYPLRARGWKTTARAVLVMAHALLVTCRVAGATRSGHASSMRKSGPRLS